MFNSVIVKYKEEVFQLCEWGNCSQCYHVDKDVAMRVLPGRDRKFCDTHCGFDHTRNHWRKI